MDFGITISLSFFNLVACPITRRLHVVVLPAFEHSTSASTSHNRTTSPTVTMSNGDRDLDCLTIQELEAIARDKMDKQTRDYYNEGADSGSTLRENISAFARYCIRPRVLRDVSGVDSSVYLFGQTNSVPIGVAPTAMQCLAHPDGEIGTAHACRDMKVAMGLSSFATKTLEDVAKASAPNLNVLQLYLFKERERSRKLIKSAKRSGFKAVFLTVDTPLLGRRNLELRNQFRLPPHLNAANFVEHDGLPLQDGGGVGEKRAVGYQ